MIENNKPETSDTDHLLAAVKELEDAMGSLASGLDHVRASVGKLAAAIEEKQSVPDLYLPVGQSEAPEPHATAGATPVPEADDVQAGGDHLDESMAMETSRDHVRRAVEEAKAETSQDESRSETPQKDAEAAREEVKRAIAQVRAEIDDGPLESEDAQQAQEVESAVDSSEIPGVETPPLAEPTINWPPMSEELRTQTDFAAKTPEHGSVESDDEQSTLEVEHSLEISRSTTDSASESATEPSAEEEDRREEVRRAVEQARAEIGGDANPAEASKPEEPRSILMASMAGAEGRVSDDLDVKPPVLIIENTDGRVELVQVFETLNRVQQSAQAALMNHSSSSISVGLNLLSDPLDPDELVKAAEEVFGKECSVKSHGSEISILVGLRKVA